MSCPEKPYLTSVVVPSPPLLHLVLSLYVGPLLPSRVSQETSTVKSTIVDLPEPLTTRPNTPGYVSEVPVT